MATTHEVLPKFGLAFLVDDHERIWTIVSYLNALQQRAQEVIDAPAR